MGDAARNNRVQLAPTPDEDMLLFFSRRIGLSPDGRAVPIPAGVRLSGTVGGLTIGALAMQTRRTATTPANQYGVLRLRKNLRPGSDIGLIMLDREAVGRGSAGNWNRVAGVDANFRLPRNWDWNSYAVGTRTPGRNGGQYTWRTSLNHEGNFFHGKVGVLEVGRGFADDLGFFRRTDTRKFIADIGIRPRPSWLAKIATREMHPHFTWNYYETLDGRIAAKDLHTGYTFFLSSGAFFELSGNPRFQRITAPFRINRAIAPIPAGGYAWTDWQFKGATNASDASKPSNASSAARRSSTISAAIRCGAGRLAEASMASSLSQNTSSDASSRATSSARSYERHRPAGWFFSSHVAFRSWRLVGL